MVTNLQTSQQPVEAKEPDWVAVISRIAHGDQQAMTALYNGTSKLVFGLVLRILNDRGMAEEVLLDVYAQVWRQANRYDTSRGAPLGWITTIARSRAIDRLRSERHNLAEFELNEATTREPSVHASPDLASEASEKRRFVRRALDALPIEQREVIELSYFAGLTQSEIAIKLNQPLGTVKTRTRLGMIKLREVLKPLMETT
ncbi:MAG: sigma-70 family RNA polymerase sigma factor [Acidobacteriota bacterium]